MRIHPEGHRRVGVTEVRLHLRDGPTIDQEQPCRQRVAQVMRVHIAYIGSLDDTSPGPSAPVVIPNLSTPRRGEQPPIQGRHSLRHEVAPEPCFEVRGNGDTAGTVAALHRAQTLLPRH